MVNEVRIWVAAGRVKIHPRCKQLIGCLRYGIWDNKRTQFARSGAYGHFDALAALVYLIRNIDINSNPVPAHYGLTQDNWVLDQEEAQRSANAQAIMSIFKPRQRY